MKSTPECRKDCDVFEAWLKLDAENADLVLEIESVKDKNKKLRDCVADLDNALSLAHTELTKIPDWPDTKQQHYISEIIEQALKGGD